MERACQRGGRLMDKLLDGKITAEVEGYGREGRKNQAEPSTLEQLPLTRLGPE